MTQKINADDEQNFKHIIADAMSQPFSGWDFSILEGRMVSEELPWDYRALAKRKKETVRFLLDMGTGGGELLAEISPFPDGALATEAYFPNLKVAAQRLHPLGVQVVAVDGEEQYLPFRSGAFDLVLNRHESFSAPELLRILAQGGCFLTQQVGGRDNIQLNEFLQEQVVAEFPHWTCRAGVSALERAGFEILRQQEVFPEVVFRDFAAIIFYLRVIAWQIADFSVERYYHRLFELYRLMQREGGFYTRAHRFMIEARRPT